MVIIFFLGFQGYFVIIIKVISLSLDCMIISLVIVKLFNCNVFFIDAEYLYNG